VADAAAYAAVAGAWQPVQGGRYLIVFPDGQIGMGEAGAWQLCDGRLVVIGTGDFYIDELACGDYGTSGLMLESTGSGKQLVLLVPSRSGAAGYTVSYQRASAGGPLTAADQAVLAKLVGSWSDSAGDRTVLVGADGAVSLLAVASGASVKYAGTVTGYYTDGVRVQIPCSVKQGVQPPDTECGVVELQQIDAKQIAVVGSYGSEVFMLSGDAAKFLLPGPSTTPTATPQSTVTVLSSTAAAGSGGALGGSGTP
jgi:hypothetical protein